MKNDFPEYLTAFFNQYLELQKGLSQNTIASYSDAFLLLFRYYEETHGLRPDNLTFSKISKDSISDFCQWLEDVRGVSVKTRNLRLTAIHSFFKYIEMRVPSAISLCKDILNIPMKKCEIKPPTHLSDEEVKMLFAEPDIKTKSGIRDLAVMTVLYDTGTRVSELTKLKIFDVRIEGTATVRISGKGNKQRIVPVSPATANIIKVYYKSNRIDTSCRDNFLFANKKNEQLTRPGINYILDKYVQRARSNNPGYFSVNVTAHVMRHSKAVALLLSEINLIYIRDFLGHSSVITTEHYARTNPEFLRKAIEKNAQNFRDTTDTYSQNEKEELKEFLKTFRK